MDKQAVYDRAAAAVRDPSIVGRLYDSAESAWLRDNDSGDVMADAMAVEAVYKYLTDQTVDAPAWAEGVSDPDGVRVAWVIISTGETVPVFIPGDGRVIYSEW